MAEARLAGANLLIVDGCEQLGRISRLRLRWQLWRRGWGVIVTAHRDVGYPILYRTGATVELTKRIVARLVPAYDSSIDQQAIAASFAAARGDVRETLFGLYDHFECERRARRLGTSGLATSDPDRHEP